MEMLIPPPYFLNGNDIENITPVFTRHDLSSHLKLKSESEEIKLQFDKVSLKNSYRFNPETGETIQATYEPAGSKYFIATEPGVSFTADEMTELSKIIEEKFSNEK